MKVKVGPGISEITITDDSGNVILGATAEGYLNTMHVTEISFRMRAGRELPQMTLECEIFGSELELDVQAANVEAVLRDIGINRIERIRENKPEVEKHDGLQN